MKYEYDCTILVGSELEIDTIGNCVIRGTNKGFEEFYLIVKTELGWTEVIEYGPLALNSNLLPYNVSYTYKRMQYNDSRIDTIIDKFLNNGKYGITKAELITIDEAKTAIVNPIERI